MPHDHRASQAGQIEMMDQPYPLASCPHGAVVGYCAMCREQALDWAMAQCIQSRVDGEWPLHLLPILLLALEREALIGTNRIAALTIERVLKENDDLRKMIGLMTYERVRRVA